MRLGGPIYGDRSTPEAWVASVKAKGYRASPCPCGVHDDDATVQAYAAAAAAHDIVIAEVGAWSNPISPDDTVRSEALAKCKAGLDLADRIGARCCVNISGARGERWDGPHPDNLTDDCFDLIVDTVREIIDTVKPSRTYYTLETMPWAYPDSADSYLRLLEAIDRERFAVHLDPVNIVNCPSRYFRSGELIRDCFAKLGPYIRSCHAKDIVLHDRLTLHLDEARPGLGGLDYHVYLTELDKLDPDTPLILEHLPTEDEYDAAAAHLRGVATELGLEC